MKTCRLLIVMAKMSEPGKAKTRLQPMLSPEASAQLNQVMIRSTLNRFVADDRDVELHISGLPQDGDIPTGTTVRRQAGKGLGERMAYAVQDALVRGYQAVVLIGTDHPTLPGAWVDQAFDALDNASSLVVGPTFDGGYYLIGMNEWVPDVFSNMTYSTATVFHETLARAAETPTNLVILPPWYDVDRPADLVRLKNDLRSNRPELDELRSLVEDIVP